MARLDRNPINRIQARLLDLHMDPNWKHDLHKSVRQLHREGTVLTSRRTAIASDAPFSSPPQYPLLATSNEKLIDNVLNALEVPSQFRTLDQIVRSQDWKNTFLDYPERLWDRIGYMGKAEGIQTGFGIVLDVYQIARRRWAIYTRYTSEIVEEIQATPLLPPPIPVSVRARRKEMVS